MSNDHIVGITTKGHAMTTNTTTTSPRNSTDESLDLDRLAVDLERHDHRVAERHAGFVVTLAREHGLTSPSLDVLTDPTASTVARDRALALVTARLRRLGAGQHADVLATVA